MSKEQLNELVTAYRELRGDGGCAEIVVVDGPTLNVVLEAVRQLIEREQGRME